ncbi:MAG TPA: thioesterase family protein, partial [Dietzia timorensis]
EEQSDLASFAGMFDLANGIAVRADPEKVIYPNIDLTAHLFRQPEGEWVGYDTRVSFGGEGVGLTETVLHDMHGPVGTSSQILTVRPR